METASGRVTLVQEDRFLLVDEAGRSRLFMLAHDADLEPQDLPPLAAMPRLVTVRFDPADGLIAGLVRRVHVHRQHVAPARKGSRP
jgi:hypothetical protein